MALRDYQKLCPRSGRALSGAERDALAAGGRANGRPRSIRCDACGRMVEVCPDPGTGRSLLIRHASQGRRRHDQRLRDGLAMKLFKGHVVMPCVGHERVHVVRSYLAMAATWREAQLRIARARAGRGARHDPGRDARAADGRRPLDRRARVRGAARCLRVERGQAARRAGLGACRTYFHVCVAGPTSDGCEARGEADIGNIGEPSDEADALFGSNPKGRGDPRAFLRYSPSPYARHGCGLAP